MRNILIYEGDGSMVGIGKMKKVIIGLVISCLMFTGCATNKENKSQVSNEQVVQIGIMQIVEHSALDNAREGFIDALKNSNYIEGENLELEIQNAQGDISTAQTIAERFKSKKKDLILAIATPTAQAAYNATKDIPILITAVTDPVSAGLVETLKEPNTNVTGTSDATPIDQQFELLKALIPKVSKVGILYNTSEINSEIQVNKAKKLAKDFGVEVISVGITNVTEVSQALDNLLTKVDVLYTPADNLVASSMPLILSKSIEKNIPIIGAEKAHIEAGALATKGIDYYNLGFQTGEIAISVLQGESPSKIPIETLDETKLIINIDSARKLGIDIPQNLLENAEIIEEVK